MRGKVPIAAVCLIIGLIWLCTPLTQEDLKLTVFQRGHFINAWVERYGQPVVDRELLEALEVIVTLPGGQALTVYRDEERYWVMIPHGVNPHDMTFTVRGQLHGSKVELSATPRKPLYFYPH